MEEAQNKTFNAIYADGTFKKIVLSDVLNKGGASGKIYCIKDNPTLVAKIFHNTGKSM